MLLIQLVLLRGLTARLATAAPAVAATLTSTNVSGCFDTGYTDGGPCFTKPTPYCVTVSPVGTNHRNIGECDWKDDTDVSDEWCGGECWTWFQEAKCQIKSTCVDASKTGKGPGMCSCSCGKLTSCYNYTDQDSTDKQVRAYFTLPDAGVLV